MAIRVLHGLTEYGGTGTGDVKALAGRWQGHVRLRIGEYRVILAVGPDRITIVRVRHRSERIADSLPCCRATARQEPMASTKSSFCTGVPVAPVAVAGDGRVYVKSHLGGLRAVRDEVDIQRVDHVVASIEQLRKIQIGRAH